MERNEHIEELWRQFAADLRTFIFSKIKNEADTDDILQNTFLKIHDNIHTLKERSSIKAWIYQITRNQITDHFRANNRNRDHFSEKDFDATSSSGRYMDTAVNDMIQMMDRLSPEYCEALCLTEIEGMNQKQYAEKTGLSYSGAKSRVQRARVMLKDLLLNCCHYQFDKYGTVFGIQQCCSTCCSAK